MPELERLLVRIDADTSNLRRGLQRSERRISKTQKVVAGLSRSFSGLGRIMVGLAGAFGVREIARAADNYKNLRDRVKSATEATGDFVAVNGELLEISQRTFTGLEQNVALFQRLAIGAKEFGAANTDVLKVTETVQQLGIIGGASLSALSAGTTQFAQAMAGGVVRAEEFNSILENIPEVAVAIADGLDMSVGELRKAVIAGKVLSEQVFEALLGKADEVNQRFQEMDLTLTRAFTNLGTVLTQVVGKLDEASGFTSRMAEIITTLTAMMAADAGAISDEAEELALKQFKIARSLEVQARLSAEILDLEAQQAGIASRLSASAQARLDLVKQQLLKEQQVTDVMKARVEFLSRGGTTAGGPPRAKPRPEPPILETPEKIQKVIEALRFAEEQLRRTAREQFVYEALQQAGIETNDKYAASVRKVAEEAFDTQEAIERLELEEEDLNDAQDQYNRLVGEGESLLAGVATETEKLITLQDRLNVMVTAGALSQERANLIMGRTAAAMSKAGEEAQKAERFANTLGMTFASAFEDAIVAGENLSTTLQALAQDLLRVIVRLMVIQPLANAISQGIMNLGATNSTGTGVSPTGSDIGGTPFARGGVMTGRGPARLKRYAAGGVANSPQLAMFGEGSRPEAFVPLPDGRSIPVRLQGGRSGGDTFNIVQEINFAAGMQQIARVEALKIMPQMAEATARAISEANRRGGHI